MSELLESSSSYRGVAAGEPQLHCPGDGKNGGACPELHL